MRCVHLHHDDRRRERFRYGFRCDAFPEGIPEAIVHSRHFHSRPLAGDHGILFEPEPDSGIVVFTDGRVLRGDLGGEVWAAR
jgi:hypothetical protein